MNKKITIFLLFITALGFAQYSYRDSNRIGITLGLNQFNIKTSNFETKPENGWNAGLSLRGNFYNNWDMVYSIQFSENNFSVTTLSPTAYTQNVKFKLSGAQISLQLSKRIIENHLSLEVGPIVQVNGKLTYDDRFKNNTIKGTSLKPDDIISVNRFNFYPVVGITAGVKHVRLNLSYQYGINNILGSLDVKANGRASTLNGNIIFYL